MPRKWLTVALVAGWLNVTCALWAQPGAGFGTPPPPTPLGPSSLGMAPPPGPLAPVQGVLPTADMLPIRENAFFGDPGPSNDYSRRFQVGVDYLILWCKPHRFSAPVLTVGDVTDAIPGAIGQAGTQVLVGEKSVGGGPNTGTRFSLVYWVADPELVSIESNFWIMEQRSLIYGQSGTGDPTDPLIARPYYDPLLDTQNASLILIPGARSGWTESTVLTRMMGAEMNVRWNLADGVNATGFSLLAGSRFWRLDEKYLGTDNATDLPVGLGSTVIIHDNFTTYNKFIGGQIGMQFHCGWENLFFDVQTKLAVGPNFQTIRISGASVVRDDTGVVPEVTAPFGQYSQPFNIGTYKRNPIIYIPEVAVNVGCFVTDFLKVTVGYNFFWVSDTARAAMQIDPVLNLQTPGAPISGTVARPQPTLADADYWVQWLNVGLELVF